MNIPLIYNTSLLSAGQGNKEIEFLILGHVSDSTLTCNKASRVYTNDKINVKLNKDSLFSDDSSTDIQFQVRVRRVPGAIRSANLLKP